MRRIRGVMAALALMLPSTAMGETFWASTDRGGADRLWRGADRVERQAGELLPAQLPGPADAWAGGRPKSLVLTAPLAAGRYLLRLHLFAAHPAIPPTVRLAVDGAAAGETTLPAGKGEADYRAGPDRRLTATLPFAVGPRGAGRLTLTTVAGSWVVLSHITVLPQGAAEPPYAPPVPAPVLSRSPDVGRLVWTRFDDGNDDLYLRRETGEIVRLTRTPWSEGFPRFAPGGASVWYTLDGTSRKDDQLRRVTLATGRDELMVAGGGYATFPGDGSVLYHRWDRRERRRIVERRDLATGKTTRHPVDDDRGLSGVSLSQPAPVAGGGLFWLSGQWGWNVRYWRPDGTTTRQGSGCRPAPSPDGRWVVSVAHEGREGLNIALSEAATGKVTSLVDLPAGRSAEYDPRFSSDGRRVVFAAAPDDRRQRGRRADYALWSCRFAEGRCSDPAPLVDLPGADMAPDLYVTAPR